MRLPAFLLLLALLPALPAAAAPVSPARLKSDLEQGARLFRRNPDLASAVAYARVLERVEVDSGSGHPIVVVDPWLTDAVETLPALEAQARKARLQAIAEHLALRASLVDSGGERGREASPKNPPPADPDRVLGSVLEESQFHPPSENPKLAGAAARVRDTIRGWWHDFVNLLRDLVSGQPGRQSFWDYLKGFLQLGLALVGVVGLLWIVVRTIARAAGEAAWLAPDQEEDMPSEPPVVEVMEREASVLEAGGDLRGAVRALYLALLGRLHRQGSLVYDRHRTNREYVRSVRLEGEKRAAFATAVELFDRTWYGRQPVSEKEVEAIGRATRIAGGEAAP